ncbi:MAG: MgtC/SapB family protein [Phyllobacterium sp.]
MDNFEIFQRFGLAIAIGAVVGMERHWRERDDAPGSRTAGLRTFTLIGMLGGIAGLIEQALPQGTPPAGSAVVGIFLGFAAVFSLFQYRESVAENTYSVTSVIAAMATFGLGALAILGNHTMASAGGVALVAILASRELLHGFMRKMTWRELRSAIILLAMTFVILPIVPSEPIGPFGGISPRQTWMLVILLAAISFCGYVAVKLLGTARGELAAGAIGGLISSTGTTITNAQRSGHEPNPHMLAAGALGAGAVSYLRTAILVAALSAPVAFRIAPALAVAAVAISGYAGFLARKGANAHAEQEAKNPFDLDAIIKMALLLVAVGFVARAAAEWFGGKGLLIVSALSGLADVDAVTVTIAGMLDAITPDVGAIAIGVAVISNTIAKAFYAGTIGARAFSGHFAIGSTLALLAGVAAFRITPYLAGVLSAPVQ